MRSLYVEAAPPRRPRVAAALECVDVFKIYRAGPAETVALRGLDLRVATGELVAVVGPSGCGKSTLLRLCAGLERPSAGDVRVLGASLGGLADGQRDEMRARRLAVVLQSANLWPGMSALENVAASARLAGRPDPAAAARDALTTLGLASRARHRAATLSGGEQQRVAIAAAAARQAEVVLADEPTGELDERSEAQVLEALEALREQVGSTVVVVTHSDRLGEAADRTVEMRDGRAVP